jgi:tRNA/tmRNA/rRNA uracil-C5-methylase (TrmA/RlmC/RlmD family)
VSRQRPLRPLERGPQTTTIEGFTHGGEGVARIEGKAVFVPGTLPGEQVVVRVVEDRASWARAALVEVLVASPDRVTPPCPYVPACGGCDLQHAAPDAQRRLKTRVVIEQLQRIGRIDEPPVVACRAVGPDTGYRRHVQLHAAPDGRLGYHREGSHDVVAVDRCLIAAPEVQAVRDAIGDDTGAVEVAIRAHGSSGTATSVLAPGPGSLQVPEGHFDVLLAQPDGRTVPLRGDGMLSEQVAGHTYRFGATTFFQVSPHGAEALVATVLEACCELSGTLTWDLYAGVGLLSLPLARAGAEVLAVESHAPSAAYAVTNAAAAGVELRVLAEPVASVIERVGGIGPEGLEPPEVVVLDPPRAGAGAAVTAALAALGPVSIIYVACDVAALARDTHTLTEAGYRLTRAVPLDLFPMTHHVEVVATFAR